MKTSVFILVYMAVLVVFIEESEEVLKLIILFLVINFHYWH